MKHLHYFLFSLIIFSSIGFSNLFSADIDDEIDQLQKKYDQIQLLYWELKQQNLRERETIKDEMDEIDNRLKGFYEKRNSITEELFLLNENLGNLKKQTEDLKLQENSFKLLVQEEVESQSQRIQSSYPKYIQRATESINDIKATLDRDQLRAVEMVLDYKRQMIREGEKMEVYPTQLVNPNTKSAEDVQVLRIGFIQSSFLGKSFSGILLRNSSLSGINYAWETDLPTSKANLIEDGVSQAFNEAGKQGFFTAPVDPLQSGKRLRSFLEEARSGLVKQSINFFNSGGVIMYPLLLIAIFSIIIMIERFRYFNQYKKKRIHFLEGLSSFSEDQKEQTIKKIKSKGNRLIKNLFLPFFENIPTTKRQAEILFEENFSTCLPEIEKRLSTLSILATVAPLLGLLGTVTGMIQLFDVITLYGTSNPKVLASGISVALVTTQTGLSIAVPIIVIHHYLVRKKTSIVERMNNVVIDLLNSVYSDKNILERSEQPEQPEQPSFTPPVDQGGELNLNR